MKVKLTGLGEKMKVPTAEPVAYDSMHGKEEDNVRFPSLCLNSDQMEEIAGLAIDQKVTIVLVGKVASLRKPERYENKEDGCVFAEFKLLKGSLQKKQAEAKTSDEALVAANEADYD